MYVGNCNAFICIFSDPIVNSPVAFYGRSGAEDVKLLSHHRASVRRRVFLDGDEDDPVYLRKFKRKLQGELQTRCTDNLNIELLALASFCDMWYSHLKFLDVLKKYEVSDISKESIVATFQAEMEKSHNEERDLEISLEPKKKKSKKSFLDDDDEHDDVCD